MPSVAVDRILAQVTALRTAGDGWVGRCPAHDDDHQSLSIGEGLEGRALIKCHAGCEVTAILAALGLKFIDLFADPLPPAAKQPHKIYSYHNADGDLVYEVCRFSGKDFRQRRPDGDGGWLWNLHGVSKVPYRLPDLMNIATVVIVEGEKDVESLWSVGIPATCNSGGAGKWKGAETQALKRAGCLRAIILPDNDDPGRKHAEQVAEQCRRAGMAVSVIELPGLGPHGDVTDWFNAGHTKVELEDLFTRPYVLPANGVALAGPAECPVPLQQGLKDPSRFPMTDLGNAEAFIAHFGDRLRYDHDSESWFIWGEHAWKKNADAEVRELAHKHVRLWQIEAAATWTHDWTARQKLIEYTLKLEKSGSFSSMLTEAKVKPGLRVRGGWDDNPWLLGCPNGVVDLKSGCHRPGVPDQFITKQVGIAYDPTATAPRWLAFLHEIFDGDAALVAYVQRAVGYCLTGITTEQCFFMAYGTGANGKSTFLVTLDHVFGGYAHTTDIRTFTVGNDKVIYELAGLDGKRLVLTSEARTKTTLNEQVLKNFTGGEKIEAQHKYGHPFSFRPVGKIWFAVNHQPKVQDESIGFWRRVRMVPFTRTFAGSTDDRLLGNKLRDEMPGILTWAVEGCKSWQEQGLNPPPSVVAATQEYQQAEDPVQGFLEECCDLGPTYRASASGLYQCYAGWAKRNGIEGALSGNDFGRYMQRFFQVERTNRGRFYLGLAVRRGGMYDGPGDLDS